MARSYRAKTPHAIVFALFLLSLAVPGALVHAESWTIVVSPELQSDEAMKVVLADLQATGPRFGIPITIADDDGTVAGNVVLVGGPEVNARAASLTESGTLTPLSPPEDGQGYTIVPFDNAGARGFAIASRDTIGTVYGLYWLHDRLRVYRRIPDSVAVTREPAMKVRLGGAWGRFGSGGSSREEIQQALRLSINWVPGMPILDLVPWESEPEASINAANREKTRELIAYAHAMHMKYFSFANEFTYHPSLLESRGATLNPNDPKFWDAVQDKFRMLFTALPELDGVEICNDDISGFWDNYLPYDVMHETPEADWSYPKRFRTFVKKVHEVVAEEYDKQYFHFTWSLVDHEVHTQPAVFREIFTDEIPTRNFYVMPKVTRADRWWFQPYNPTFNQSHHDAIVLFETMNYYEGGKSNLFPTFSGQYFQGGLQTFLLAEHPNLKGAAALASVQGDGWGTREAYSYVLYRLMWDPNDDIKQIARDFCAIHFGPNASEGMADLYLLSPRAYQYGLHIEPISYGQFNSHYHMRVGEFPVQGYPNIDGGREHLEWLRKIYLRCKPWKRETLESIENGREVAESMFAKFETVKPTLEDRSMGESIQSRLDMTRKLIETNQRYVESIFAYFDFMDRPDEGRKERLDRTLDETRKTCEAFQGVPGYTYKLWGIEELMKAMAAASEDVDAAREALEAAPTRSALESTIASQQALYAKVLADNKDNAVKFAHMRVLIDGRDIVNFRGAEYTIDHIQWDGAQVKDFTSIAALPDDNVTVIPVNIESRPLHPFVMEQPGEENGYTARVYLDDMPGGNGWVEMDLYYIDAPPEDLGLAVPWSAGDR
ncbi:MAG: hypothetical protein JNK74_03265 [Candidatus Hydrogenedentes bacterium]|nr:hypothetical protein [Candidatus Hydrogenedentota bacterium]